MPKVKTPARKKKSRVARDLEHSLEELRRFLAGETHGMKSFPPPPEARAVRELVAAREKSGLSMEQVAAAVGVPVAKIENLEAGELRNPTMELLAKYAAAVGKELRVSVVDKGK